MTEAPTPKNEKLVKLIAMLCGVIVPFIALEIVARLITPVTPTKTANPERPEVYYLPKDAETARGNVFDLEKPAGTYRLCVVGDSFTFGPKLQFFDTFPARLEEMLNLSSSTTKAQVINYGTPGFSTHHELELVRNAFGAHCDSIILEITLNDPQEAPLGRNPLVAEPPTSGLLSYSKVAQFISTRIEAFLSVRRYIDYHYDLFTNPKTRALFEDSITRMKFESDAHNTPFAAVVFPLFDFPIDQGYPFAKLHDQIRDYLTSKGIPALDLQEAFRGADIKRIQLIPGRDSHPNEIGHRIAAEAIYRWLQERQALPQELFKVGEFQDRDGVRNHVRVRSGKNVSRP